MTPSRPYLVKALYEWLLDNDLTPHLLVDATHEQAMLPVEFVEEGRIVLNINPSAVRNYYVDNEALSFNARFSGQPMDVYVPMAAIMAIYAREDGQGMGFGAEPGAELYHLEKIKPEVAAVEANQEVGEPEQEVNPVENKPVEKKKPSLKVVK